MKQRIHLKRRRHYSKKSIFLATCVVLAILTLFVVQLLGNVVSPLLLQYTKAETNRFASYVVSEAVNEELSAILDEEDLFSVIKNESGEIQAVDFNSAVVNHVLKLAIDSVYEKIKLVEEGKIASLDLPSTFDHAYLKDGGIVYQIPLGVITGNPFLMNIGPSIPIKLGFIGDVTGNLKTEVEEYGINNALVELKIKIEVTEQLTMPFLKEQVPISIEIPVAMKMVQGKIPTYYQNGIDTNSNLFSIPLT